MGADQFYESFAEKPLEFTFTLEPRNWFEKLLFKWKIKESKKVVYVKPITFGARAMYSKYARKLDLDKISKGVSRTRADLIISEQIDDLVMAIAIAIHNKDTMPPKWMLREIRNFTQNELDQMILFVKSSLDTDSFLNSIILINGMSLQTEEIIASGDESPGRTK